jgi:hypothetical protein
VSDKVVQHRAYETTSTHFVVGGSNWPQDPIVPDDRHQWRLVSSAATTHENFIYLFWFWETDA